MKHKKWALQLAFVAVIMLIISTPVKVYANSGISVIIDGYQVVNFEDQPPAIVDGRTFVPVSGVFQALGFNVSWDGVNNRATLARYDNTVVITIGSSTFTTNGLNHTLDVPAQIIGGRTLVPLRAVLESVGYELEWLPATQTILITRPRQVVVMHTVLIDGLEASMGFDSVHNRFIIEDSEYEGYHINLGDIFPSYVFYINGERSNANAFRTHIINNAGGAIEVRSPRHSAILQRDADGSYANITFNQMLLIGYTAEEAFQIFEYTIFHLTNEERAANSVPLLMWNDAAGRAARTHSQDMAINDMLSHTGSDGSNVGTRLRREGVSGYRTWGENASMSFDTATPASRVSGWMNSPGHRENMLHRNFTHMGVGSYFTQLDTRWRGGHTQKFVAGQGIASNTPRLPG